MSAMYLDNKYTRWYYAIINKAKSRITEEYTERHHIIPRSLGGGNNKDNIVRLTVREHYIAHHLLIKMLEGGARNKMINAFWYMSHSRGQIKLTSRQFEYLKLIYAEAQSEISKDNWNKFEYRETMKLIQNSPEYIKNQSNAKKQNWEDPEFRTKQMKTRTSDELELNYHQ